MFMGKKRKAVMLGVNVFLVLALLWSVVFTVDRKNAAYTNTDIEFKYHTKAWSCHEQQNS